LILVQKLAIIGLLLVGQVISTPERHRRDAPVLTAWEIPVRGFEGGDVIVPFGEARSYDRDYNSGHGLLREGPHEEYGTPHEEYGPPQIPHEEYGPPPALREEPATTEQ
jgi:hypothetical protein